MGIYIQYIYTKNCGVKFLNFFAGDLGRPSCLVFLEKQFFLISRYMLFSKKKFKKILKSAPSLYPLFPCSDFVSQMWGWFGGGGGGCNVFLTFYAISNISRKNNLGIQNNYFSFNVFFVFFLYAGNIVKCPFTYSYWLNGRWFLQIVDIGNFIRRLEILNSAHSLTG